MKTVIDKVLEIIQLAREGEIDSDLRSIMHRVEQLKPVFKQDIIDARLSAPTILLNNKTPEQEATDYFTQKYEQH